MPLSNKISNTAASAQADAFTALLNNGYLRIYDGAQPADADTALASQVLLAEFRFGSPAYAAAVNGVALMNAVTPVNALASGRASWFRALKSDGTTKIEDGSVGIYGCNINFSSVSFASGRLVGLNALDFTVRRS